MLNQKVIGILGATYDIETENALSFILKSGKLKAGDKVGHLYLEGDYATVSKDPRVIEAYIGVGHG